MHYSIFLICTYYIQYRIFQSLIIIRTISFTVRISRHILQTLRYKTFLLHTYLFLLSLEDDPYFCCSLSWLHFDKFLLLMSASFGFEWCLFLGWINIFSKLLFKTYSSNTSEIKLLYINTLNIYFPTARSYKIIIYRKLNTSFS